MTDGGDHIKVLEYDELHGTLNNLHIHPLPNKTIAPSLEGGKRKKGG